MWKGWDSKELISVETALYLYINVETMKTKVTKDKLIFKEGGYFSLRFFSFLLRCREGVLIELMLNINWQQICGEGQ